MQQDVDFGWGILGRLNKGGWIVIEQANVGEHQWRIVHFQMSMSGRVVFKNKVFDTTEDESQFAPLPVGLDLSAGDPDDEHRTGWTKGRNQPKIKRPRKGRGRFD